MAHPLWILNASLFFLLGCAYGFIYFSSVTIPARESIDFFQPQSSVSVVKVNIAKIYENDLFGTYKKQVAQAVSKNLAPPPPPLPQPQRIEIPEVQEPTFLDPLNITLKGVVVVGTNDVKNRVIIQDNSTNQELMIKVGDAFQDAQLIRIFKNKIIFLRSNGQQEILYLREYDAKMDPAYFAIDSWDTIIKKISNISYKISPLEFVKRISNLSQFIQMLGVTTAYKQGVSIGCRVGTIGPQSLGQNLGFNSGDIIVRIGDKPISTVAQRLEVYNYIIALAVGDSFTVEILFGNATRTITYTLENFAPLDEKKELDLEKNEEAVFVKSQPLYSRTSLQPMVRRLQDRDRDMMVSHGKNPKHKMGAS